MFSSLLPRFDERITPDFYRLSGKLRAIANALFVVTNLLAAPQVTALDAHVHWRFFPIITAVHAFDLVLGVIMWRKKMSTTNMRRLTYFCVALETLMTVAAAWVYGSVNSPFIGVGLVFIIVYRLAFDTRTGLLALGVILLGTWAIVIAEVQGLLPAQPMGGGTVDQVYLNATRHISAMITLSVMFALAFVVAHWAVGRLRHKELAIRLLRESLHAGEEGKVGRHTGRTLRDTYALGRLLGIGGMGEVYAGTHLRTRRNVAVKMLHPHLIEDTVILNRFRREAEITGRLGSEHIVEILDVDEDDGQPFLVFELLDGQSLASRLKMGALDHGELANIVDQMASALDIAHRAGVVHRDLKPENVFLCPRADGGIIVKLLDFGVSKIRGNATALTQDVAILGTPDYMSPEQATGQTDDVEASSDLFALGGLVYTMITTKHPFVADSVPALLRQICDEEPIAIAELAPTVPPGVSHVVAIAMAKEADDRYANAAALARDLRVALSGTVDPDVETRARKLVRGKLPGKRTRRDSMTTSKTQPA